MRLRPTPKAMSTVFARRDLCCLCAAVFFFTASPAPGPRKESTQQSSAAARGLPPTVGWHSLPGTNIASVCPATAPHDYAFADACAQTGYTVVGIAAYSGSIADTDTDRLVIWGGGHQDYGGNEVYALNLGDNPPSIVRLNNPTLPTNCYSNSGLCNGGPEPLEVIPKGCSGDLCFPNSRHTTNALAYVAHAHALLSWGGAPASQGGTFVPGLWSLDLPVLYQSYASNGRNPAKSVTRWTRKDLSSVIPRQWLPAHDMIMAYDPVTHQIWNSDQYGLLAYDYDKHRGEQYASFLEHDYRAAGAFDPDHNYLLIVGGGADNVRNSGWGYWDLKECRAKKSCSYHWITRAGNPPGCGEALDVQLAPGIAYDPIWHVAVLWYGNAKASVYQDTVWLFNPDPKKSALINALGITVIPPRQCAALNARELGHAPHATRDNTSSSDPATISAARTVFKKFHYFPQLDLFAICYGYIDCAVLRLRPAPGGPTSPPR